MGGLLVQGLSVSFEDLILREHTSRTRLTSSPLDYGSLSEIWHHSDSISFIPRSVREES